MNADDFFGKMNARPDHPDMWKLSEVLLALDSGMDEAADDEAREALWQERVAAAGIDERVLSYAAMQRGMRVLQVNTPMDLLVNVEQITRLSSTWLDGFIAGCVFTKRKAES